MRQNRLIRLAVRSALLGGAAVAATATGPASAQDSGNVLEEVVVTGSRIRRVDLETATPLLVLDATDIRASGVTTLGDLVQRVPSVAGAATNPQVNNGGGDGQSNVELRGLGTQRTLVLLNGRRFGALGKDSGAVDINLIPVNFVERVEVVKEGAGAIYGSDAVAGVVNFITKREFEGADLSYDYGITSENDGERHAVGLSWGATGERSQIMIGANYNKQDSISAGDRKFSAFATYLYGSVFQGGSSRAPNGRIFLDGVAQIGEECDSGSITRIEGAAGTSPADYRCFVNSGNENDFYNYQPFNLILTPQERGSLFTLANYKINDSVETYLEFLYNRTSAGWQIAALPFDSRADNVVISADSIYNPFGVDLGGSDPKPDGSLNPNALWRLTQLGNRAASFTTATSQTTVGVRGDLLSTGWTWDASLGYGRSDQDRNIDGYLLTDALSRATGPSFIAADGTPTCGTPTAPISGCTPVDIFNLGDPAQQQALSTVSAGYNQNYVYESKQAALNATGDVFDLPAGTMALAVGAEYRDQNARFATDTLSLAQPPLFLNCLLAQETCSGNSRGSYDVTELYAELFVPILADLPGVDSLNLTLGTRYSDYSTFGNTTNSVVKLEYRPIKDVLIRGSFAEVFRAPTLNDLYRAPENDAPTFNDPCVGLTLAAVAANPNLALACQNVPRDGSFEQPNGQITGLRTGSTDLDPETGEVITFGVVYDSSVVPGLSLTVDFWDYQIDDLITLLDPNFAIDQCVATGNSDFCGTFSRFPDGSVQVALEPTFNLGRLSTNGIDFGARYRLDGTRAGDFRFSLDVTYIDSYENTPAPGAAPVEIVGTYDRQFGNYAQYRALANVGWSYAGIDTQLTARYIDAIKLVDPDGAPGVQPDLEVPSYTYLDLMVAYTFAERARLQIGVQNLTDKQPPLLYQNNVINANTDVQTYDTIGRMFFGSISYKF
jgi:outer membrane receptor protein involved in Fe transport